MNKYIEIYEEIKNDIIKGIYNPGAKLPSKRNTAETYNASIITVEHAYDLLIEESYIEPRERSGYFVVYNKDLSYDNTSEYSPAQSDAAKKKESKHEIVSYLPYSIYSKTVKKVLSLYGENVMEKPSNNGLEQLRTAISGYLGRSRHMVVNPDQIYIGAGAEYLYRLIVSTLGRDKTYGIESPSYSQITNIYNAEKVDIKLLPLVKDGIDSKALWESKVDVLHITPYRSYPSRITASAQKKREYLSWSKENSTYIIEDDCESEFSPSRKAEETIFAIPESKRVIYVNTFTLTISPSLRMGYMVIPKELIQDFNKEIGFYSCTVPSLEQLAVATLIETGEFERHLNRIRRKLRTIETNQ